MVNKGLNVTPVGGIFFLLFLFVSAFFGVTFFWTPALPLLWLAPNLYRRWVGTVGYLWLSTPPAMLELLFGVKYVFSGPEPLYRTDRVLVISNHRNRLDWMFLWGFFHRYGRLQFQKIVLKAPLRNLPGPGWAVQHLCFLFLNRRWDDDQANMNRWMDYHKKIDHPMQLLIFPEGTDLSAGNIARSHAFSAKSGLAKYDYVMHPRIKGFWHILSHMRSGLDTVYDVTIAYPNGLPQSETDLLMGYFPKEIHIDCQRYNMSEMPKEEEAAGEWCKSTWQKKEVTLRNIYADAEKAVSQNQAIVGFPRRHRYSPDVKTSLGLCLLFWLLVVAVGIYLVFTSSLCRWYLLITTLGYIIANSAGIFLDQVEIELGLGLGGEAGKKEA